MAEVIRMPKMSDTMTEGVIHTWLKKVGDDIKPGDILAEVETDKATMELENYVKGTLLHIGIPDGGTVPVDAIIAIVGKKGEDISKLLNGSNATAVETKAAPDNGIPSAEPATTATVPPVTNGEGRIKVSPLARKLAADKGIDIHKIPGTGDQGRIVKRDIENYQTPTQQAKNVVLPGVSGSESFEELPVSQMRKAIARRLTESKNGAPHFYLTMSIRMDKAAEARKTMNEFSPVKISMNDLVVKAVAHALQRHPMVNSSWLGDKIRVNRHIHIGVAVAIDDGLIVPVIRFADSKSVSHISAEVKTLADKAKNKKLQPQEFEGNTFTISNLGMYGIDEFTAIINPPDACILAVGAAKETAIVENGQIKAGLVMKVTLSCDHRVVDGAMGAAFLQTLKELLENPVKILV